MTIVLSTLTTLLDLQGPCNVIMPHIMALATEGPQIFRDAVNSLPPVTRTKLENSMRQSILSSQQQQQQQRQQLEQQRNMNRFADESKKPTIHLKTDFSNFA